MSQANAIREVLMSSPALTEDDRAKLLAAANEIDRLLARSEELDIALYNLETAATANRAVLDRIIGRMRAAA